MVLINHFLLLTALLITLPIISMQKHNKNDYNQDYLNSKPFKQRLETAAKWINEDKNIELIIDIGGGHNSIANYVTGLNIIVVDPTLNKSREIGSVEYVKREYQFWKKDQDAITRNKNFAVVIMGLQLDRMQGNDWQDLFKLINDSQKTIVEYSTSFSTAKSQFTMIAAGINKKITNREVFDFSSDFIGQPNVPVYRKMVLFENKIEKEPAAPEKQDIPSTSLEINESNDSYEDCN
jgi:hypothetical protein